MDVEYRVVPLQSHTLGSTVAFDVEVASYQSNSIYRIPHLTQSTPILSRETHLDKILRSIGGIHPELGKP
jgi:hypothetical protein